MIRAARVLPLLILVPFALTGCGSERTEAGGGEAGGRAESRPSGELASRARALGVAPELVYVTEAPGFVLARQSVGVFGGDGFSATYVSRQNGSTQLRLYADRGTMTAAECARQQAECEKDGEGLWYLRTGERQEYVAVKAGHLVRLEGDAGVPRDVLRQAARDVHRPEGDEVTELLPSAPPGGGTGAPTAPVERGDLPTTGDGAPRNDVDAGG